MPSNASNDDRDARVQCRSAAGAATRPTARSGSTPAVQALWRALAGGALARAHDLASARVAVVRPAARDARPATATRHAAIAPTMVISARTAGTARNEAMGCRERAVALMKRHEWKLALEEGLRAIQLDETNAEHEAFYASLLYHSAPPGKGIDVQISVHLRRALKLDPACANARYWMGLLRERQGRRQEVLEARLERARDSDRAPHPPAPEERLYLMQPARNEESWLMSRMRGR